MNCRTIGIEVVSDGEGFSATEVEKPDWLVRRFMVENAISVSRVIRH